MNSGYNNQPESPFSNATMAAPTVAQLSVEARLNFIRKTYALFMAGILCSIVAGTICLSVGPVLSLALMLLSSPIIAIVVLFGATWAAQAVSRTEGLNYVAL
ncbi:MAG TPA: hypothetical protein VF719_04090, partial [Abditibacteriaceae bacterium]